MYKVKNGLSPKPVRDLFTTQQSVYTWDSQTLLYLALLQCLEERRHSIVLYFDDHRCSLS